MDKTGTSVNKVKSLLKSWQAFAGFHAEATSSGHGFSKFSSYIGESGRSLGERVKEHLKAPSPIHLHSTTSGHPLDPNQFNIVHKESASRIPP